MFPHHFYSRGLSKHPNKNGENLYKRKFSNQIELLKFSNYSFCHNAFKSRLLKMCQNAPESGKRYKYYHECQKRNLEHEVNVLYENKWSEYISVS